MTRQINRKKKISNPEAGLCKTEELIDHLSQFHPKGYDLSLGRITKLLERLGNPQTSLPPVFHVAGTNGKGSLIANLRALLEAGGFSTHVHTSPHLVNYNERYRIARKDGGRFASDEMLANALARVAKENDGQKITVFELLSATMFVLFSEQPADYAIVEVGLGGRFDGTNVIENPLISIITTVSLDHQMHLGNTISEIAFEKAGIMKPGRPVVIGPQADEARQVIENRANELNCPIMICGQDFDFHEEAGRFIYQDNDGLLDLPMPNLNGQYQLANSATAIAATRMAKCKLDENAIATAMKTIYWPGRFEKLPTGKLTKLMPQGAEIWIDGGHNQNAGQAIAAEIRNLNQIYNKKLVLICAMLVSKDPQAYFKSFTDINPQTITIPVTGTDYGITAPALAECARSVGLDAVAAQSLEQALSIIPNSANDTRILIAGSLYLVGEVLKKNGTAPV